MRTPLSHKNCHFLWLELPPQRMILKHPPTSLLLQIPWQGWWQLPRQLWQRVIHSFFLPLVPQSKPQGSPHLLPWAEVTLLPFPERTNKDILKCTFSNSLNYNYAWNSNPWGIVCRGCFSNATYPLFVLLPLQIIYQGQAEYDTSFETSY